MKRKSERSDGAGDTVRSEPLRKLFADEVVVLGEQRIGPNDLDLLASLRQRGYEVVFQETPESQRHEPGQASAIPGPPEKGG